MLTVQRLDFNWSTYRWMMNVWILFFNLSFIYHYETTCHNISKEGSFRFKSFHYLLEVDEMRRICYFVFIRVIVCYILPIFISWVVGPLVQIWIFYGLSGIHISRMMWSLWTMCSWKHVKSWQRIPLVPVGIITWAVCTYQKSSPKHFRSQRLWRLVAKLFLQPITCLMMQLFGLLFEPLRYSMIYMLWNILVLALHIIEIELLLAYWPLYNERVKAAFILTS